MYRDRRKVRLGDVDRRGRLRLDATARVLQDIATDDAADADLDRRFGWLVRRTLIDTVRPAVLGEWVDVATWCTGTGRSWAERRSSIRGERGAHVDTVSLWVQIDVRTGRPSRLAADFVGAYGEAADGRTVSARLALPTAPDVTGGTPWVVRRSDIDPFGHVNNAANWEYLEQIAVLDESSERIGRAEMEYLHPVTDDMTTTIVVRRHDPSDRADSGREIDAWLVADEIVVSAARWTPGGG